MNENGIRAIENGLIAEWINDDVRQKYRNPPAHTKYVYKEVALECREYVEQKLFELARYKL